MGGPSMLALLTAGPDRAERARLFRADPRPGRPAAGRADPRAPGGPRRRLLSMLLEARDEDGTPMSDASCATSWSRCSSPATRRPRPASRGRSSGSCACPAAGRAARRGGEEYAEAAGKEALRLRPVLPVVLRHLQAP